MKAIILAAGVGKRLRPITDKIPKCLLEINGEVLIIRYIKLLREKGITNIVIVVGHLKDSIIEMVDSLGFDIKFRYNPQYECGSITSLYAAKDDLKTPCLLMDADVYFDKRLLHRLIDSPYENCFLLDTDYTKTGEEMLLGVNNNRVVTIRRDPGDRLDLVGEGVGFVKLNKLNAERLGQIAARFISESRLDTEYEESLNELLNTGEFGYERADGLKWIEIDFKDDIDKARQL